MLQHSKVTQGSSSLQLYRFLRFFVEKSWFLVEKSIWQPDQIVLRSDWGGENQGSTEKMSYLGGQEELGAHLGHVFAWYEPYTSIKVIKKSIWEL